MNKQIELAEKYLLYALIIAVPLFITTAFPNAFVTGKLILLAYGVGLLILIKTIKTFLRGSISFNIGVYDFPVLLLGSAYLASAILNTPNKMDAFFLPGVATIIISSVLLYFLINQADEKVKKGVTFSIYISAIVIAVMTLLSASNVLANIPGLPDFIKSGQFNPIGGFLPALMYLGVAIPLGVNYVTKEKEVAFKAFWGVSLALILFGLTMSLFNLLPGKPSSPQLPSYNTSWSVAVDSLKVSPLLGMGPGNYITAFNRFRPIEYNSTAIWRLRFTNARSFYMTVLTETGLIGLAALLILGYSIYKQIRDERNTDTLKLSLLVLLVLLFIFPANIVFIMLLFVLLALNNKVNKVNLGTYVGSSHDYGSSHDFGVAFAAKLPILVMTLPVFIISAYLVYKSSSIIQAEYLYNQALRAVVANDGKSAYELLQRTITKNPYVDRYHTTYAQINLGIADSIARNENLTDDQRNQIAQLIQQAIREGKATVTLNPQRANNWEVLARIYQAVIPLAQNADAFAVQTYGQAINLDPINPDLRIALGGIYYSRANYDAAVRTFELAVAAKPDFANSHYNLAFAYREKGLIDNAINQMTIVMSLLDRDSADYDTAQKVLEDLQSKKSETQTTDTNGENLTAPQQNQGAALNPKVELPEDATPPSPQPTAAPNPSPAANQSPTPLP
jgi:tetratricopeptide (TPR) repeat protein